MKKVKLGILGAGRIMERVMADMPNAQEVEVTAVASRDLKRAQNAANQYHIPLAYGNYLDLAQSNEVDLVYIATPNPFHAEQANMMMRYGKHVICEKPLAVNTHEVQSMIDCAQENDVFLMEAMWTRFLPCTQEMMKQIKGGVIGEVRNIFGEFSWHAQNYDPTDRVFSPAMAGGALLDLGVYPLMLCMQILNGKPVQVQSLCRKTVEGVDMHTSVQMQYSSGAIAQFFCGMDARGNDFMQIFGTKGYITLPNCWHPKEFTVHQKDVADQIYKFDAPQEGYHFEFDHAACCIRQGLKESPEMPLSESLEASSICTEIRKSQHIFYPSDINIERNGEH